MTTNHRSLRIAAPLTILAIVLTACTSGASIAPASLGIGDPVTISFPPEATLVLEGKADAEQVAEQAIAERT